MYAPRKPTSFLSTMSVYHSVLALSRGFDKKLVKNVDSGWKFRYDVENVEKGRLDMTFGERLRARREEMGMSREALAAMLGITSSAISNYENDTSFPKREIMLRLFDCLDTDPNTLFQDSFVGGNRALRRGERKLLEEYRELSNLGRETVLSMIEALRACQEEAEAGVNQPEPRVIPLYLTTAAAGYASPAFGEDFDYIPVEDDVPAAAEYAVRIQGDSMVPYIEDGSIVYVSRDPLKAGDVGIFCVDGDILCKQYYKDPMGIVYLFSLNRARADADVVLSSAGGRSLVCFGRVIMRAPPLPGM